MSVRELWIAHHGDQPRSHVISSMDPDDRAQLELMQVSRRAGLGWAGLVSLVRLGGHAAPTCLSC